MKQIEEVESGGACHRVDEDTGKPYWELWGADWKDSEDMDPHEIIKFDPRHFPPGTRIVVIEPGPDSEVSQEFYASLAEKKKFYPKRS